MSRNRLFSLLIALSLVVLALIAAPPAAQAEDCYQFNTYRCIYYWNPELGCCVTNTRNCIWYCL
ncbi:MAG TPA: hypothetical protein VF789_09230 [Thermoanaerobaculia bacterium]